MRPDSSICIICKGVRKLCGKEACPLLQRYYIQKNIKERIEKETARSYLFGPSPPNVFVGHYGYPNVRFGPMINIFDEYSKISDSPSKWYGLPLEKIIEFRSVLFRAMKRKNVKKRYRILLVLGPLLCGLQEASKKAIATNSRPYTICPSTVRVYLWPNTTAVPWKTGPLT